MPIHKPDRPHRWQAGFSQGLYSSTEKMALPDSQQRQPVALALTRKKPTDDMTNKGMPVTMHAVLCVTPPACGVHSLSQ